MAHGRTHPYPASPTKPRVKVTPPRAEDQSPDSHSTVYAPDPTAFCLIIIQISPQRKTSRPPYSAFPNPPPSEERQIRTPPQNLAISFKPLLGSELRRCPGGHGADAEPQ